MTLQKCPRCDLNYITDGQKYCKVCMREVKGENLDNEVELCSICNEAPALPGRDVCLFCLKEMNKSNSTDNDTVDVPEGVDASSLAGMENVTSMDEMIPEEAETMTDEEYGEFEHQMSLEEVREDEEKAAEDEESEDDM